MIGNIPEKVIFIDKVPQQIDWEWDDFQRKTVKVGPTVIPLFVADPLKPKTIETGMSWASGRYWNDDKGHKPSQLEVENKPIKVKIISLEKRSEGGRAYKVMFGQNNYYVDLREDVLLDCILECKIEKGVPNCEFIWGKVGSQMKLVCVGSELHQELIQATEDGKKSKVSKSNMEVGGVYRNKKDELSIYLGDYWCFTFEQEHPDGHYWGEKNTIYKNLGFVKRQLWLEISKWRSDKSGGFNENDVDWCYYHVKNVKKATVIEKVGQFNIPTNWREQVIQSVDKSYSEHQNRYDNQRSLTEIANNRLYYAPYYNFVPVIETPNFSESPFMKCISIIYGVIGIIPEKK